MNQLTFIVIFFLTITFSFAQHEGRTRSNGNKEPHFSTAGEQEEYWTKRLFKFDYRKRNYDRFKGNISRIDSNTFRFDSMLVRNTDHDKRLILMFEKGILVPWMPGLTVNMWDELKELNPSFKVKRFRLSVHMFNMANPLAYFMELTNEHATSDMDVMTFIEGANLTFFKEGWIML